MRKFPDYIKMFILVGDNPSLVELKTYSTSSKGPHGNKILAHPPKKITLDELVSWQLSFEHVTPEIRSYNGQTKNGKVLKKTNKHVENKS